MIPQLRQEFAIGWPQGLYWFLFMVVYTVLGKDDVLSLSDKGLAAFVYITLCFDLIYLFNLLIFSGGLKSPLIMAQLLFTMLFALLFPKPIHIIVPLLLIPGLAIIDSSYPDTSFGKVEFFLVFFYFALNAACVYIAVRLDDIENVQKRSINMLEHEVKEKTVLEERTKLAREMHDGLGGSLSSLIIQTEYLLSISKDPEMNEELAELKLTSQESMDELRRSLAFLKDDFDVVKAIADMIHSFNSRTQIHAELFVEGEKKEVLPDVQLCIFRVCQESLNNIQKHSQAEEVNIFVEFSHGMFFLKILDDGVGFDQNVNKRHHYGLSNMAERAIAVNAEFKIFSQPEVGTRVELGIPLV